MSPEVFGYTSAADIDLSQRENERWFYGQCVIFVRALDKTEIDTFRMLDVALTARNIIDKCIADTKFMVGGASSIGSKKGFFVGVGGPNVTPPGMQTLLPLAQNISSELV